MSTQHQLHGAIHQDTKRGVRQINRGTQQYLNARIAAADGSVDAVRKQVEAKLRWQETRPKPVNAEQ